MRRLGDTRRRRGRGRRGLAPVHLRRRPRVCIPLRTTGQEEVTPYFAVGGGGDAVMAAALAGGETVGQIPGRDTW